MLSLTEPVIRRLDLGYVKLTGDVPSVKRHIFAGVFGTDEAPTAISFEDTGQALLKQLDEVLGEPAKVELELEPTGPDLPSPRVTQSDLVQKGHLPEELAMRLARVRELTEPPSEGEIAPVPSAEAAETMISAVKSLIDLGQQKVVELGMS